MKPFDILVGEMAVGKGRGTPSNPLSVTLTSITRKHYFGGSGPLNRHREFSNYPFSSKAAGRSRSRGKILLIGNRRLFHLFHSIVPWGMRKTGNLGPFRINPGTKREPNTSPVPFQVTLSNRGRRDSGRGIGDRKRQGQGVSVAWGSRTFLKSS